MIFQKPNLLYALIAVAIPIIIHLINLRKRQKIYFSSIRFLKEIKQENNKKLQIKNLLILLSRILAIIFLVMESFACIVSHHVHMLILIILFLAELTTIRYFIKKNK